MQDRVAILTLPLIFLLSLGLSIGLTYAPCYSGLCVETFYPFGIRLHIATFYGLLASTALALALRASSSTARAISARYLLRRPAPILDKRVSLGGAILATWVTGLIVAVTAFWWPMQWDFYDGRAQAVDGAAGVVQLAATGLTGHYCDVLVGLLVLPVARNSMLSRAFGLSQSTLLFAHKIIGYVAFLAVVVHGVIYYSWIPNFGHAEGPQKNAFGIDNPTITQDEAEARGPWGSIVLPSGAFGLIVFIAIVVTSLPSQRRARYNCFYYTHVVSSVLFFFLISIHASTDFYFLLPGLVLWLADWAARLRWLQKSKVEALLENAGEGWYRIRLPIAATARDSGALEARGPPPLQAFYLNFPSVSKLQCHAFTAAAVGSAAEGPTFLFRRAEGKKQKKLDKEWTCKLGELVAGPSNAKELRSTSLSMRLEGPYITSAEPVHLARRVLCLVGGTGITGALSLAQTWLRHRGGERSARFRLVWTVRTAETARVAEVEALQAQINANAVSMEIVVHVSRTLGRVDPVACLASFFEPTELLAPVRGPMTQQKPCDEVARGMDEKDGKALVQRPEPSEATGWVYCSGPSGLLDATDGACLDLSRRLRASRGASGAPPRTGTVSKLDWYCAKWEV